jgi:YVTN family beta-propeller protein
MTFFRVGFIPGGFRALNIRNLLSCCIPVFALIAAGSGTLLRAQTTAAGATFGTVIPLPGGTPADEVLDQSRSLLYLVNTTGNRIDMLSTVTNTVTGSITVGRGPLAAAMSMDNAYLYVTNSTDISLSVIDLNARMVTQTVTLPAAPQGVEVGSDGRALVTTAGTGTAALPANTLLIFDQTQPAGSQLTAVVTPPPPSTPAPLTTQTLATPDTKFYSKLARTPNGQYIVGIFSPTTSTTYMFVYEVASGTILRNRTVTGQSTVLAMSPDGSRFMAGYTLYDISTLSALGQMNNANAPFSFTLTLSTRQNTGGSVFTPDGKTLYGAFNNAAFTNPAPPTSATVLLVADPSNLGISLGIRLPESIVAKMVMSPDGANAWSLSASGLIYLPISTLYTYPIIAPSSNQVFLSQNPCNPGLAQGTVQIQNLGGGKLTYAVTTVSPTLTAAVSSGVAPSNITFTMEPGRVTTYTRLAGTNLVIPATGGNVTISGQSLDIILSSPNAINIPPVIRVYMNYRQSDQRGIIVPIPVTPNNSSAVTTITGTASLIAGDQGLEDIVLDQPRNLIYITNAGYNRIEVFDTVKQVLLTPIPVNQLPHQMALSTDGNTLYVASTGGELIDMVDLTIQKDVGHISFPAVPRQAAGQTEALFFPQAMAVGSAGLEFIMSNGTQWKVVAGTAIPRPVDPIAKNGTSNSLATPVAMLASPDNSYIVTLAGNGIAYLYQASTDAYVASNLLFSGTIQSFYGPISAGPSEGWFAINGLYTNGALTQLGGAATPTASTGEVRNVLATAPFDANDYVRATIPVRTNLTTTPTTDARETLELVNITNGAIRLLAVAPDNPRFTLLGTTRYNVPPRSMVIDNNNIAYVIGISGLSVIPLTPNGAATPTIATSAKAIVNASDGSTTLKIGGVINISGANLANTATASTLPPPTVLGGSCVTFNDVALPLLQTAPGQIQAQIPTTVTPGSNVVQVISLGTGMESTSAVVTVQAAAGAGNGQNGGSPAIDNGAGKSHTTPKGN